MTLNDYLVGIRWHDAVIVGAGHNGLVAALLLAKAGLEVLVVEGREQVGGTFATERPFAAYPELAVPTGADLLGLVPPGLMAKLGVELPAMRREPLALFPYAGGLAAMTGRPADDCAEITRTSSEADGRAAEAMLTELGEIGADLGAAWLEPPQSLEMTAETYVRPALREPFISLCRETATRAFERWGVAGALARTMLAPGIDLDAPGSGATLLVQALARLADGAGGALAVRGGMGTVAHALADEAVRHGAVIETESKVSSIVVENGAAKGVVLAGGKMQHARAVICGVGPARMNELVGHGRLPAEYVARVDAFRSDTSTLKVCLALRELPHLAGAAKALGEDDRFAPTIHLPADGGREGVAAEWHVQSAIDPSLRDTEGRHAATLVVRGVPYALAGTTWDAEEAPYVKRLVAACDRVAPGTSDLVLDALALTPPKIESRFGAPRGQLHPVDDRFAFADRLPCETPIKGLFSCSGGTAPLGGVVGAAGHNAALKVLAALGR